MFQKFLGGFMVVVIAITGLKGISFANVEVEDNLQLFGNTKGRLEYGGRNNAGDTFSPTLVLTRTYPNDGENSENYTTIGFGNFTTTSLKNGPDFYTFSNQGKTVVFDPALLIGFDFHFSKANVSTASLSSKTSLDLDNDRNNKSFFIQGKLNFKQLGAGYYYFYLKEHPMPFNMTTGGTPSVDFSQDNFASNSSAPVGLEGHRIQFDYKIAQNVRADFRIYLLDSKEKNYSSSEPLDINRYQFNFTLKF